MLRHIVFFCYPHLLEKEIFLILLYFVFHVTYCLCKSIEPPMGIRRCWSHCHRSTDLQRCSAVRIRLMEARRHSNVILHRCLAPLWDNRHGWWPLRLMCYHNDSFANILDFADFDRQSSASPPMICTAASGHSIHLHYSALCTLPLEYN